MGSFFPKIFPVIIAKESAKAGTTKVVADGDDEQQQGGIGIAEQRVARRFERDVLMGKDEEGEQDGHARDEHDEGDVRRIISARRVAALIPCGARNVADIRKVKVAHGVHHDDEHGEDHDDDLLRDVHLVAEGAEHLPCPADSHHDDDEVEKEIADKDLQKEGCQKDPHQPESREDAQLHVAHAAALFRLLCRFLRCFLHRL